MSDAVVGHLTEKVVIPPQDRIEIINRKKFTGPPDAYRPFEPNGDLVPPMVTAGEGYRVYVTGLTHDERGYPATSAEAQETLVRRLVDKVKRNADEIILIEETNTDGADVVVVAYGISARVSHRAMAMAQEVGIRVGLLRLVTVWPFPETRIRELAGRATAFVVPEINLGQIVYEVERCAAGRARTVPVTHAGGSVHDPNRILAAIKEAVNE
jgi:2-oxoglutarate ferredoxin oxidoreductase subunit alpha